MKSTKVRFLSSIILVLMACMGFSAKAADPEPPTLTMFYPAQYGDEPAVFDFDIKAYVYFASGSKVKEARVKVTQNGSVLGYSTYTPTSTISNSVMLDTKRNSDDVISKIETGEFTIEVVGVTYEVNGAEYTYNNESSPLGTCRYVRPLRPGTVVDEYGLGDGVFRSTYLPGSEEGTYTFVFNKPVKADRLNASLEYGMGEQYFTIPVPHTLSSDGLTLVIDFRTARYGVDDMAPGVTFVDDYGNPVPPPTYISLNVTGVDCVDGTKVVYEAVSLDGAFHATITGSLYKTFDYEDVSFPTPVLSDVEFFAKSNPAGKFKAINEDTDMMAVYILGAEYIKKADMELAVGSVTARIADSNIQKSKDVYTVELPAEIRNAGSKGLTISLVDVEFTTNDGGEHVIKPYVITDNVAEVLTLADLYKVEPNKSVVINVRDGLKVTMSNDAGYTFIEDATAGVMVMTPDYKRVLDPNTMIHGRLVGTYLGYGSFMLDVKASSYVDEVCYTKKGIEITDLSALKGSEYTYRLVTIMASDALPITVDGDNVVIGGEIPVITDFIPNFMAPDFEIESVTGIYYPDPSGASYVLVREFSDFSPRQILEDIEVSSIAELLNQELDMDVVLNLSGAKVTYYNADYGISYIEDDTAAIIVMTEDGEAFSSQGNAITGALRGQMYTHEIFMVYDSSEYTESTADVTYGVELSLEDAVKPENARRLVTFTDSVNSPIQVSGWNVMVGDDVAVADYFNVLDLDYEMPKFIKSVTGILVTPPQVIDDFDDPAAAKVILAVRDASDIVRGEPSGITTIKADGKAEADVYDLHGVKVRTAGQSLKGLSRGLYLQGGQKVMVK